MILLRLRFAEQQQRGALFKIRLGVCHFAAH